MSKIIGIIAPQISDGFTKKIISGAIQRAAQLGYSVAVFSTLAELKQDSLHSIGEINIYNLINFDLLDGVILMRKSFFDKYALKYIDRLMDEKCRCPSVSVATSDEKRHSVQINHREHFMRLTRHMIEAHGCKRLYCLTGYKETGGTLERIEGFRDAMNAHGLTVLDDDIIYGDYWIKSGTELADDIISGRREKPDGIVCANDSMACALVNELIKNDICVPEDIAVAGYDTDFAACSNIPSVASYNVPNVHLGAEAVDYLYTEMTGETELPPCDGIKEDFESDIIAGESCGCKRNFKELLNYSDAHIRPGQFNQMLYGTSNIFSSLSSASTMIEYIDRFNSLTYIVDGETRLLALCLCNDWNEKNNNKEYLTEGYPEQMMCKLSKSPSKIISVDKRFPTSVMFPELMDGEPAAYFFVPLHFLDRCFGYCVLSYGSTPTVYDRTFTEWCSTIATTLEYLRVKVYVNERNTQKINMVAKAIHNRIKEASSPVSSEKIVVGYSENEIRRIPLSEVFCFFADDDSVYIHCDYSVYRSKQKLYELEGLCADNSFFRISKSVIANISKISGLSISSDGGYYAIFTNGKKHKVARRRSTALKQLL